MEHRVTIGMPEGVNIYFEIAGIGSRFVALAIDTLVQAAIMILIVISGIAAGVTMEGLIKGIYVSWYLAGLIVLMFLVFTGYFIFFEMVMKGKTPGKAVMKLRVIRNNGQPLSPASSIIRNIFRIIDMFPAYYGVGLIVMFISKDSRRIGDYIAGTIVVKEYMTKIPKAGEELAGDAADRVALYPLDRQDLRVLKEFLERRHQLINAKRQKLALDLASCYWDKFYVPLEERKDPELFLQMLLRSNSR